MRTAQINIASVGALLFVVAISVAVPRAAAQSLNAFSQRALAANVIVPQRRAFDVAQQGAVQITAVDVTVAIRQQVATTTMDISLANPLTDRRLEAELIVPVPDGAVVRGFTFQGAGDEPTAEVLPKEQARRLYDSIVAKVRDPALLEFVGFNLVRSSVFPVEAGGTQKVRLIYEHLLAAEGDRVDYLLPRSEALDYTVPWHITVTIKSDRPISTVYSPSHGLKTIKRTERSVTVTITTAARTEPGPFRMSFLLERNGVTASLFAYPDSQVGGGYFLLLAGLPAPKPHKEAAAIKRELTLVIDRSGSMNGKKLDQVRQAARQIIAGLEPGEFFNIITYNEAVDAFARRPVVTSKDNVEKALAYLDALTSRGGTNIHDALVEALRPEPAEGILPIVLFLTDGLPTIGQTSEVAIRNVALKGNPHRRRVFTFGVGDDVNAPLLDKIALSTRATPTYVLPGEDVEVKVASVFKRLTGPVLAAPALAEVGTHVTKRLRQLLPAQLPDLFEGDQLIVLGQYTGAGDISFELSGNFKGRQRKFNFNFDLSSATTRNSFVPRLWASRKIGQLVDAVRELGADADGGLTPDAASKVKELTDEIVRLSTEFGILTEYTAFLARQGTDLADREQVDSYALDNFERRAVKVRSGRGSVIQSTNNRMVLEQRILNRRNAYANDDLTIESITSVQQVNDRAFYRRGRRWIDSRAVGLTDAARDARVIEFGSEAFQRLLQRMVNEGRQGCLALGGEILLMIDGEPVLVKGPSTN